MTEVRSFRRVFDLERRIYSVDRLRLNPSGIPVRGLAYLLAAVIASMVASALPVLGRAVGVVPWYLRELAAPAGLATVLAVIRIDGRTFHLAAEAQLRLLLGGRRMGGVCRRSGVGRRWRPPDIVFLPDGSDYRLRRLRYRGPGAVLVLASHRRDGAVERRGIGLSRRSTLRLSAGAPVPAGRSRQIIALEPGAQLLVAGDASRRPQ